MNLETRPTYQETLHTVSDALVEVRKDNATLHPHSTFRVCEDTFIGGAIDLYMGVLAPCGVSKQTMAQTIKQYADTQEKNETQPKRKRR